MYNIVGAMFASEEEARKAMDALAETPEINGTTILQMSLMKRKGGELKLCDNFTSENLTSNDTVKGGLIGGLIGILGGPLGVLLGGATGALVGKAVDKEDKLDSKTLIAQAAKKLEEGDLALIILANENDETVLDHMLVKYNDVVIRYDADVIAKEVEQAEKMEKEMAEAKEEENA
jgi:uncharacterized membrane protein